MVFRLINSAAFNVAPIVTLVVLLETWVQHRIANDRR